MFAIQSDPCGRILSVRTAKVSVPSMTAGGLESWIYMPCDASPHAWPGGVGKGGKGGEWWMSYIPWKKIVFGHLKTRLFTVTHFRGRVFAVSFRQEKVDAWGKKVRKRDAWQKLVGCLRDHICRKFYGAGGFLTFGQKPTVAGWKMVLMC